jgi:hypothetical protein
VFLCRRSRDDHAAVIGIAAVLPVMIRDGAFVPEPLFDGDGHVFVNRAGMRLLLLNTELRQQLQNFVRLDLKLACQLVNSDLQLHK